MNEDQVICRFINEGSTLVIEDSVARIHIEADDTNSNLLRYLAKAIWDSNPNEEAVCSEQDYLDHEARVAERRASKAP